MNYQRTSILRINSNCGDAEFAKNWALNSISLLNDAGVQIKKIYEVGDGFDHETFSRYKSARAQFYAIKSITIDLPEFFSLNRDRSVNASVNEVVEYVEEIDREMTKLITEIDTWFE